MYAVKLEFLSGLHVDSKGGGEPDVVQEFVHSDTLSSAIAICWSLLFGEDSKFFENLPYRVSSAFPYIGDLLLFPAPKWIFWKMEKVDPYRRKLAKKVKWLSKALFERVISGEFLDLDGVEVRGSIAFTEEEAKDLGHADNFWVLSERQRVNVDRIGLKQEGGLFFFGTVNFARGSGLYFLVDLENNFRKKFESAVEFLGDSGIGADRNCGMGHFKVVEFKEFNIMEPSKPNGYITLSLFNPSSKESLEELLRDCAYSITTRSGWIFNTTYGRPPVRVFEEGSFFSEKPEGRILTVLSPEEYSHITLSYPVFRDFRCLCFKCKKGEISL